LSCKAGQEVGFGRTGLGIGERFRSADAQALHHAKFDQLRIGDDQRPVDAKAREEPGHDADRAEPEIDIG